MRSPGILSAAIILINVLVTKNLRLFVRVSREHIKQYLMGQACDFMEQALSS